jgi:hypothetical protein
MGSQIGTLARERKRTSRGAVWLRGLAARIGIGSFEHRLAVCAIFKNEAPFLGDWLLFHAGVGVDHFFLYNNESDDDFLSVLRPWIDRGMVTLKDWPGEIPQKKAYNDCRRRARNRCRWIAFIDIDEYLFSPSTHLLPDVLKEYEGYPAVFVYWHIFGSSGNVARPAMPIVEACTLRFDLAHPVSPRGKTTGNPILGKSIVNPRLVQDAGVHFSKMKAGRVTVDEQWRPSPRGTITRERHSTDRLRINHYWSRSIEDLREKARHRNVANGDTRDLEAMLAWDKHLNSVKDLTIMPVWERVLRELTPPMKSPPRPGRTGPPTR